MSFEQEVASELVNANRRLARLEIQETPSIFQSAIAQYLLLPGLVGFWPMSSVQRSTGNVYDLSGQGRTLTYNGNPTFNIYNNAVPYIDMDGGGDYLSRADETDLDILGTESWAAVPGLTLGGWFNRDGVAGTDDFLTKWNAGTNNRSYRLVGTNTAVIQFIISNDGTATKGVSSATVSAGAWLFVVGKFVPSASVTVFVNGTSNENTASVPASVFNGNAEFDIGALDGTASLTGNASLCFLCANALPDATINSLFARSRGLFGV